MFQQKIWLRGRELTHAWAQINRGQILHDVARIRTEGAGPADRPGLGRWSLSVPFEDHAALVRKYPDLAAPDSRIRSAAWLKFMHSSESEPYRMRERL